MILYCQYDKTLYRDEKVGETRFAVIPQYRTHELSEYGNMVCSGVIPAYPHGIPLELNAIKDRDGVYRVMNIRARAYDRKSSYDFLVSGFFYGIGEVKAEEYLNDYGYDIFNNECVEKYKVIYEKTRSFLIFEELLNTVYSFGGNYHNAYRLYKKCGADSLAALRENPYELTGTLPFNIIDGYALANGFDRFDKRRVKAIIHEALRILEARGDTCTDVGSFCQIIIRIDKDINPLYVLGEVLNEKEFSFKEETFSIYDSQLLMCEENITFNISRAQANKSSLGQIREDIIKEIEKEENITYGQNQLEVFGLLEDTGIKIITGGPGTGKTTAINGLIKYIRKAFPDKSIAMAAPTANAAKRMREKTGENATTIHKLLEIKPFADSLNFGFKNISDDFIIIDECSFIDTRLASIIFQSVKVNATVILVGDVDQLPSVASGNVFKDLIESDRLPVVRLEKIFRQSGNSSIIENAYKIKTGNTALYTDDEFSVIRFEDENSLFEEAVRFMEDNYDKEKPYSVRLYTPVRKRKYLCCTHNFNKRLQEHFSDKDDFFVYGYTRFYVGDPVIFTRNNYPDGYANGDEGRIVRILQNDTGKYGVAVLLDDVTIEIKGDNLLDMELSFAITTHKSQGSECNVALVVVPASPKGMLDRSLVYVATTRARKRTVVFTEGDSLSKAILNDRKKERMTGLKDSLIKHLPSFPHNNI